MHCRAAKGSACQSTYLWNWIWGYQRAESTYLWNRIEHSTLKYSTDFLVLKTNICTSILFVTHKTPKSLIFSNMVWWKSAFHWGYAVILKIHLSIIHDNSNAYYRIFQSMITRTLCIPRTQYFPVLTNMLYRYRAPYVYRALENTWNPTLAVARPVFRYFTPLSTRKCAPSPPYLFVFSYV
jgi:hypothetical protein